MEIKCYKFNHEAPESSPTDLQKCKDAFAKYAKTSEWHNGYSSILPNLAESGIIRSGGYSFNLRPFLKAYLVWHRHGGISRYFAPSKKALRNILHVGSDVRIADCPREFL